MTLKVDSLPETGETVVANDVVRMPGGKGFNQAVALSKLGGEVTFVSAVGDDGASQIFSAALERHGGRSRLHVVPGSATGLGVPVVDALGHKIIVAYPGASMKLTPDVVLALLDRASWDALLVHLEVPEDTLRAGLKRAREKGVLTVVSPAPWQPFAAGVAQLAEVVVGNRLEAMRLIGESPSEVGATENPEALLRELAGRIRSRTTVLTLGSEGSAAHQENRFWHAPGFSVPVIDTTGAGDAFVAGFLYALLTRQPMDRALRVGNAAGALACTAQGASESMPARTDVLGLAED